MRLDRLVVVSILTALSAGCARFHLGTTSMTTTRAEDRIVFASPVGPGSVHGQVYPRRINCAEPSPDVVKVASEALSVANSMDATVRGANLPADGRLQNALSLSRSHAEAAAQLTQRLATIQLLRDGMYRACEAFANGALSDTSYAVLLSRYDDTMITMLLGELAAGNFGQALAQIGSNAGGSGSAAVGVAEAEQKVADAKSTVDDKQKAADQAKADLDKATEAAKDKPADAPEQDDKKAKQTAYDAAKQELAAAKANLDKAEAASHALRTNVQTQVAAGEGTGIKELARATQSAAEQLANMQRKYIENINFDALVVACISTLDRRGVVVENGVTNVVPANETPLARMCQTTILPKIQEGQERALSAIAEGHGYETDARRIGRTVEYLNRIKKSFDPNK